MKRLIPLTALAAVPSASVAGPDYPHRDWGKVAILDMTAADAITCIARELNRNGDAMILPVEGGGDIDFTAHVMFGKKLEPWETFKVRTEGEKTVLRIFYRHPIRAKRLTKDVEKMRGRCLKVTEIIEG
jgi:hypothetical protein